MRRLAIIVGGVLVLVVVALVIAPSLVSPQLARARIAEQITEWIGRPVAITGEPEISLFPRPSVRLKGVVIEGDDGPGSVFATVDELHGTIKWLPLVVGRIEFASFDLVRPMIELRVDEDGNSNWTFGGQVGVRVAEAQGEIGEDGYPDERQEVVLGRFRIIDGVITYAQPGDSVASITDVSVDINWPATSAPATARGSLTWHGETVDISATLDEPLELIAARSSPGRFTIDSEPIGIGFDGKVGRDDLDFWFEGDTSVATNSLRRVINWVGQPIGASGAALSDASISGGGRWQWPVLSFSDAEMRLDGNVASGAVSVDFGGERVSIVGTFAFDLLDLTAYADAWRSDVGGNGDWAETPISLPALGHLDSDIRLSANRVVVGATRLDGVAVSSIVNNGLVRLRLGETSFYGGRIRATVNGEYRAPMLTAEALVLLSDLGAEPALADMFGVMSIRGVASGTLEASTAGASWGELVQQLKGSLLATIENGSILGVDVGSARTADIPSVEALSVGEGQTAFASFDAHFSFFEGRLLADQITAIGPGFDLTYSGWGSLTTADIGGQGVVWLVDDDARRPLPFDVAGKWLQPVFSDRTVQAGDPAQ